jgi:hypothetical protein
MIQGEPCSLESFKGRKRISDGYHHAQSALFGKPYNENVSVTTPSTVQDQLIQRVAAVAAFQIVARSPQRGLLP